MKMTHFTDARIDEVRSGAPLTAEERSFLIESTPNFEECSYTSDELVAMSDQDLMNTVRDVWSDYVSSMY